MKNFLEKKVSMITFIVFVICVYIGDIIMDNYSENKLNDEIIELNNIIKNLNNRVIIIREKDLIKI